MEMKKKIEVLFEELGYQKVFIHGRFFIRAVVTIKLYCYHEDGYHSHSII